MAEIRILEDTFSQPVLTHFPIMQSSSETSNGLLTTIEKVAAHSDDESAPPSLLNTTAAAADDDELPNYENVSTPTTTMNNSARTSSKV